MTLKAAMIQHLIAKATTAGSDVYRAGEVPTSAGYPLLTVQFPASDHIRHMGGSSLLVDRRVQVDAYARDDGEGTAGDSQVDTLAEEVRAALDTFRGSLGSGGDAVDVHGLFLLNEYDDYERPTDGSQRGRWRRTMEFAAWQQEAAPTPTL